MPHQLLATGLQARDIYPELKKYFYKENSIVRWEEFVTTKFALWIDTRSSTNNILHGSGRVVEKSGILLQIKKVPENSGGDLTCYVFSLEDAVTHLSVTDPSGILTIEKQGSINMGWKDATRRGGALLRMDLHLALCNFISLTGHKMFCCVTS